MIQSDQHNVIQNRRMSDS